MGILECRGVTHGFGEKNVLSQVTFSLNRGDKMGLTGRNGAGKSTLLRILTGEILSDEGDVVWAAGVTRGYLDQYARADDHLTILQYLQTAYAEQAALEERMQALYEQAAAAQAGYEKLLLRAEGCLQRLQSSGYYDRDVTIARTAGGLGLAALGMDRPLGTLSGGQRAKAMLAKLLLSRCDVLLLDEPTNFLDREHVAWLTGFLRDYDGSFLIISHDNAFLDGVTNCIADLEFGRLTRYQGNLAASLRQKEANRLAYLNQYESQQREIEKLEDYIRRNKVRAATAKMAHSREKALARMDKLDKPVTQPVPHYTFPDPPPSARVLLQTQELVVGYDTPLTQGITLRLRAGEKLAVCGLNGIGKTTLLKTLLGMQPALSGGAVLPGDVRVGYYEQEHHWEDPARTAVQEILAFDPHLSTPQARKWLGRGGLSSVTMAQPLETLSGGEQAKVKLCKLMMRSYDLLVFDEPTNHLDVVARASLEKALTRYVGGVIVVSHDPAFNAHIADRLLDLNQCRSGGTGS
ncbi:MAG: ABC-F family ATP-binding cassette domain-containing protein [Eubacteriales bacterium]|nr:ABC-F family ATP-binding cassette domain-containing protein [Eubacteriales bacterium]